MAQAPRLTPTMRAIAAHERIRAATAAVQRAKGSEERRAAVAELQAAVQAARRP